MTKRMIQVSDLSLEELLPYGDAFFFGIKGLSINMPQYYSLEELKPIIDQLKKEGKEVFLSLNKNMHDSDLEPLNKALLEIESMPVAGIFYYDMAIVSFHQNLNLKTPLVWAQEHLTTNAYTCEFWRNHGASYVSVSAEVTLEEILEMRQTTDLKMIVPIFGYLPMFTSKRKLVKNYLETFSLSRKGALHYMEKEGKKYPIKEESYGTTVYSHFILNGLRETIPFKEAGIDYFLFNTFLIPKEKLLKVMQCFKETEKGNELEKEREVDSLFEWIEKGFLYKETIFKVKS